MLLFAGSLIAFALQAAITASYIEAAVIGNWTWFGDAFSIEVPGSDPNKVCFDYCAPKLPFLIGWIGAVSLTRTGLHRMEFA